MDGTVRRPRLYADFLLLFVLALSAACAACSESHEAVEMNDESLDRFLRLPFGYEAIKHEIVSLPEPGDSGIPGPTDYVALVAAISVAPDTLDGFLKSAPDAGSATPSVNPQFQRPWLSAEQRKALQGIGTAGSSIKDVSGHLARPAKRALAVPAGDSELVLYVEFVAP